MAADTQGSGSVARVFIQQPERVAAAWRQLRASFVMKTNGGCSLLDDVVEPFIRELGRSLAGEAGSAWSRTRGLLRLSPHRGVRALHEELSQLRRCIEDSLEALRATDAERGLTLQAVDEAAESAMALLGGLCDAPVGPPRVPFGGLVVELYEHGPEPRAFTSRAEQYPVP